MIFPPFLSNKSCEKINTPAVLIFILLSHDDVETHASMAFWRTNEIDIYLFWLCIQIWYLIFDIWFSFLFYFSVPFFSLFRSVSENPFHLSASVWICSLIGSILFFQRYSIQFNYYKKEKCVTLWLTDGHMTVNYDCVFWFHLFFD